MVGPAEADIDFDIIKNDNDTFTVKYTPPGAGHYTIMVLFADQVGAGSGGPVPSLTPLSCQKHLTFNVQTANSNQPLQNKSGAIV